jgi:gliding motility-associated-like protein
MKRLFYILILLPIFAFSQQEIEVCEGDNVIFTYSTGTNQMGSINWYIDNTIKGGGQTLTVNWADYSAGTYIITADFISIYNCPAEQVSFQVITKECEQTTVYIPNCFTPNEDNTNEFWAPKGFNYQEPYFFIMNRWGNFLFSSHSFDVGWDGTYGGKICQDGVYIYVVRWKDKRGRQYTDYGHLTLLR